VKGSVDPFRIFERDGWRCQACLIETPKSLRGTRLDNAPELDHVVQLAKGGEHSEKNCQLLCRLCNIDKSDSLDWRPEIRRLYRGLSERAGKYGLQISKVQEVAAQFAASMDAARLRLRALSETSR
jgi:5-methylcytosine-specific restriction endonuclease McrA